MRSEDPGRVLDGYLSDEIFREPLAQHLWDDVLEDVPVAVSTVPDKPVFRADVVAHDDLAGIASVGDALDEPSL